MKVLSHKFVASLEYESYERFSNRFKRLPRNFELSFEWE